MEKQLSWQMMGAITKAKVYLFLCRGAPTSRSATFQTLAPFGTRLADALLFGFESVDGCLANISKDMSWIESRTGSETNLQLGNRLVLLGNDFALLGVEFGQLRDAFGLLIGNFGLFNNQVRQLIATPGLIVGTLGLFLELTDLRSEIVRRIIAREGCTQATFEVGGKRNVWLTSMIIVRRLSEASKAIVESAQHFFLPVGVLDDSVIRLFRGHHLSLPASNDLGGAARDPDAAALRFVVDGLGGRSCVGLGSSAQLDRFQTLLDAGEAG
ncbi:hypothetical protein BKA81DRAFT_370052 [Phyllosticta paracitricarpa]